VQESVMVVLSLRSRLSVLGVVVAMVTLLLASPVAVRTAGGGALARLLRAKLASTIRTP
jgi:hypothetical protein